VRPVCRSAFGAPPSESRIDEAQADGRVRTGDIRFTKPVLYQLSYVGAASHRTAAGRHDGLGPVGNGPGAVRRRLGVAAPSLSTVTARPPAGIPRVSSNGHSDRRPGLVPVADPADDPSDADTERDPERLERFRRRARVRGVNPIVYFVVRAVLLPSFLVYFRLRRIGAEHIPRSGPVLLAANHRSFIDPFMIGALMRRPVYYVAKRELFRRRSQAWVLNALGAFPIDRGRSDEDAIATAREILARGDCVVIFPEGTRVRPGPLGAPRRGAGRLALETGVPVVPIAVIGTEEIRRRWRIRPRRVTVRCGRPLRFAPVTEPSPALGAAATERIWERVSLQWEWLGGAPARRAPAASSRWAVEREARAA
jgi:1-acyl-sn-glycerol-3-phosphate acyltransferase